MAKRRIRADNSIDDLKKSSFWIAFFGEFLGVLFLVVCACGSCSAGNVVQVSLGFAFSIATLVWASARVSGGHLNPAVTFGFLVARRITIARALFYIVAQTAGALVGAAILKATTGSNLSTWNLCTSTPNGFITTGQTFVVELLITFVLVWTVFATVDSLRTDLNGSGPLAIGIAIGMCHLWAAPLTGAGMNPARVFGPAVVSNTWQDHWAYWIGPLIGGAAAALIYDFIFAVNATPSKFKGFFSLSYNNDNYDKIGEMEDDEVSELQKSGSHHGGSNQEASYGALSDNSKA